MRTQQFRSQKPEARSQKPEARSQCEGLVESVKQKNSGFTLVELSIVLVIIGLLVGGILAGADLIKAAKLNKIINERQQIMTALNTFYLKYNCIPGDCYNISTYLSGETNGDGSEILNTPANGAVGEVYTAWKQLAAAGLYPGNYTGADAGGAHAYGNSVAGVNVPASKAISRTGYSFVYYGVLSGNASYYNGSFNNMIWFGSDVGGYYTSSGALKPVDAYNIDKKIDDGIPGTGKVSSPWVRAGGCDTPASVYNAPSASAYYISNDTIACQLAFLLDW